MSSGSNYSVSELRRIFIARKDTFYQIHDERFTAQRTRLQQHPDQTDVLKTVQQDINQRVSVVSDDFEDTLSLLCAAGLLVDDYDQAEPNVQPQLRDQLAALFPDLFADIGVKIHYLEGKVRQLEGIDVTDSQ